MSTRIIVGLTALPVVLIPMWLGGIWAVLLFVLVGLLGGYEFYNLMRASDYQPARWLGLIWLTALILQGWQPQYLPLSTILSGGFIITFTYALFQKDNAVLGLLATVTGAIYIGIILGQAVTLRFIPNGLWWLLLAALITWANDTLAYFAGQIFGRRKLWPRLSPKKTWEGTIGGLIGASLIGALIAWLTPLPISPVTGIGIGFTGGILATLGDLSVSMLKRHAQIKDTGTLFPGHGGMLDRLDSLLFVLPFVYKVAFWL